MKCKFTILTAALVLQPLVAANAQEDTWKSVASMPTARESVASCAIGNHIYALGGFPGGSDRGLDTNERYDPLGDAWAAMAPMPTGRRMPVAGSVNGKCYAIGGRLTDGPRALDLVEEYDPVMNSWSTRASMPTARFGHASTVIGDIIYVVGGSDMGIVMGTLEAYDPAADNWTTLAPMPAPRALMGAASFNGKMYVIGGSTDPMSSNFSRVDIYDPGTNSWSRGADMPFAKFSLSASVVNGRIYAIGGADGPGAIADVAAYDPQTDSWSIVSPLITPRARFTSAVAGNRIYAIGGTTSFGNPHVGMNLAEEYTPSAADDGFRINPGLSDAWYNPATNGQGFLISVFPVIGQMFVAWFTYDTERPADGVTAMLGEPGHRWLTAQGPFEGDSATLTISVTSGGVFDAAVPVATTDPAGDGTMIIRFADCREALLEYEITSLGISGVIPIERIVLDGVPLCEELNEVQDP